MDDLPIACTLSEDAVRVRKETLARVAAQSTKTTKVENGFRLEFAAGSDMLTNIIAVIDAERQCCRFLRFAVTIEPNLGPISLELTGPDGMQGFLELQPKLLRVVQEREFERLGSSRTLHSEARLVTATNVNLPDMVEAKRFRADLYYRLNVFPIHVPPLRERPEDIPPLVRHFARHYARRMSRKAAWMASTAMDALVRYSWPGNIRELQNLIERAVIRSAGERLDVPVSEIDQRMGAPETRAAHGTLEEAERAHILATLKETQWILSGPRGAAMRLGVNRSTLQFRMKKLGIERPTVGD